MEKMMRFITGFISGGIIVYAITTLLTPQSGKDFRDSIALRTATFKEEIRKAAEERRAELQTQLEALRKGYNTSYQA